MMRNIGYMLDGTFRFLMPHHGMRPEGMSEETFLEAIVAKDVPKGATDIIYFNPSEVLRNGPDHLHSYRCKDGKLVEDMVRARNTHRNILREARNAMWAMADAEVTKALALGDADRAHRAEQNRQRLRDLPNDPRIEAATTIGALVQITP